MSAPADPPSPGMIRLPLFEEQRPATDPFPYRDGPFLCGTVATAAGAIPQVSTRLRWNDRCGRWAMRWGFGRNRYRVRPGLYAVGRPDGAAPVVVTANYKLTFDTVRAALAGLDLWLLLLDSKGINVWCAAGKGTFGTDELVRQVRESGLAGVVSHRTLIVPQLGAVGVAAHEVAARCGFRVVYGPVRCTDLKAFLAAGLRATAAMRRVEFPLVDRLVLVPVELTGMTRQLLLAAPLLLLLGGLGADGLTLAAALARGGAAVAAGFAGVFAGAVLTPLLLPALPGRAFALKGALLGGVLALGAATLIEPLRGVDRVALVCGMPAIASWCAMHFTGATPFTSPSGVEKEMRRAIPLQALALLVTLGCWLAGGFIR